MNWNYVNAVLDEHYSKPIPNVSRLSLDDIPAIEFEVRELLATWLMNSFTPFNSLTTLDKIVDRKNYRKLKLHLTEQSQQIYMLISQDEAAKSALIRIVKNMPDSVSQKRYLNDHVLIGN